MKVARKIKLLIALICLIACGTVIQETYAKYVTSADTTADITIARWRILVNSQDITDSSQLSNVITPVFAGNSNIAANVVAPTATGYFDLVIDGSNTDVSFSYSITVGVNALSDVADLMMTGYSIDGGTTVTSQGPIAGSITYGNNTVPTTIRVFVVWNDNVATETMNNADDTATANGVAKLDVTMNFIQAPAA